MAYEDYNYLQVCRSDDPDADDPIFEAAWYRTTPLIPAVGDGLVLPARSCPDFDSDNPLKDPDLVRWVKYQVVRREVTLSEGSIVGYEEFARWQPQQTSMVTLFVVGAAP